MENTNTTSSASNSHSTGITSTTAISTTATPSFPTSSKTLDIECRCGPAIQPLWWRPPLVIWLTIVTTPCCRSVVWWSNPFSFEASQWVGWWIGFAFWKWEQCWCLFLLVPCLPRTAFPRVLLACCFSSYVGLQPSMSGHSSRSFFLYLFESVGGSLYMRLHLLFMYVGHTMILLQVLLMDEETDGIFLWFAFCTVFPML